MAGFYAKEFLENPALLNESLIDTIGGFLSYYFLPKNLKQFFDYIPWIEQKIESTLLDLYNWETATDTKSTWRIGDGTAAFYNYIYLKVAGFTENDTFRSNQIWEGLINRDYALQKIYEENQPRIESIKWYFNTIGVSANDALKTINKIKQIY